MPINTIQNETGSVLTLYDGPDVLATIQPDGSAQQVPITILTVAAGGTQFTQKQGGFMNGDSYSAALTDAPAVVFTGNTGNPITFTP
jgi:hypothetical protein